MLTELRRNHDPAAALALLDQYETRFPNGALRLEATLARVQSLRALDRDDELLDLLDRSITSDLPRVEELRVLRGELRLTRGRCAEATKDFEATLIAAEADSVLERALFGRASSRMCQGDSVGARNDLREYLKRFPDSPRAAQVRIKLVR